MDHDFTAQRALERAERLSDLYAGFQEKHKEQAFEARLQQQHAVRVSQALAREERRAAALRLLWEAGPSMFGKCWRADLARALGVSAATVHFWDRARGAVPVRRIRDMQVLCVERAANLELLSRNILNAMLDSKTLVELVGSVMFGKCWSSDLARALGVSAATVRRWALGKDEIPARRLREMQELCVSKADDLKRVAKSIATLV